jgi:hypothetical protein
MKQRTIDNFWSVLFNQVCRDVESQIGYKVDKHIKAKIWGELKFGICGNVKIAVLTGVVHAIRGDSFREEDNEAGLATL